MVAFAPVIAQKTCECGAPIAFRKTGERKGDGKPKYMVVDVEPNPLGNVWIDGDQARVVKDSSQIPAGEDVYMPHWKTCPQRDRFRDRPTRRDIDG